MTTINFLSNLRYFFRASRYPTFLIIGVQKGGTTTLFDMLNCCPGFCGSSTKETGFFTKDVFYEQGNKWYLRQFEHCRKAAIKYEAKPAYIYHPDVAKRIFSFNEHMKFIVILREPAARCYSAWNMFRRFNTSSSSQIFEQFTQHSNPAPKAAISNLLFTEHFPSFKQVVEDDIERYLSRSADIEPSFVRRGIYFEQIANYLKFFKLENFLFLEQKELNAPVTLLRKISQFLNVPIDIDTEYSSPMNNVGDYLEMSPTEEETILMLKSFYEPHNETLFDQIGIRYNWN